MSIRGIIFDIDGTLGDTIHLCYEAFRQTLLKLTGKRWENDEIRDLFGPTEEGIFQRLMPDRWEQAMDAFMDAYKELHPRLVKSFDGLEDVLTLLKGHSVSIAVVTGKGPRSASVTLDELGFKRYFGRVEPGSPNGAMKPQAILEVVRDWGFAPSDIAYLGDSPYDVQASREAGTMALAAAWASTTRGERLQRVQAEGPDEVFHTIQEFHRWVERNVDHASQNLP